MDLYFVVLLLLSICLGVVAARLQVKPARAAPAVRAKAKANAIDTKTAPVSELRQQVQTATYVDADSVERPLGIVVVGLRHAGKSTLLNHTANAVTDPKDAPVVQTMWISHQHQGVNGSLKNLRVPLECQTVGMVDVVGFPMTSAQETADSIMNVAVNPGAQPATSWKVPVNAAVLSSVRSLQQTDCVVVVVPANSSGDEKAHWRDVIACLHSVYSFDLVLVYITATDKFAASNGREFGEEDAAAVAAELRVSPDNLFFGSSYLRAEAARVEEAERPVLRMLLRSFTVANANPYKLPSRWVRLERRLTNMAVDLLQKPRETQLSILVISALVAYVSVNMLLPKVSIMDAWRRTVGS